MFISVNMIHLVFSPPGFPARSAACIDGWDGWMDGMDRWVGKDLFFFCLFLGNYLIYYANCFDAP